jgi:dATP/dGTP diphosphohydrolase, N-terminal/Domain of unknown function (DUF4406)
MGIDSDTQRRWEQLDRVGKTPPYVPNTSGVKATRQALFFSPSQDAIKMKLYTAGPMTWIPQFNYPAFDQVATVLRRKGFDVLSPAEMDSDEMRERAMASPDGAPGAIAGLESWGDMLARDVKIIADEADGVVLLPGWEQSKGARLEAFIARHVGKPVFYNLSGTTGFAGRDEHDRVCFCTELLENLEVDTPPLLELDDAELDHVLTAADTLTLMKMERDAAALASWAQAPVVESGGDFTITLDDNQRVDLTPNGTEITWTAPSTKAVRPLFWDVNEGQEGPFTEEQVSDLVHESREGEEIVRTDSAEEFVAELDGGGEIRITDPDTGGQKGQKQARFDLIPATPLWLIAEHYGKGAEKYDDRNWERGYAWSLAYGAMQRHLNAWWSGEDLDPETGSNHLTAAAWHCLALLEFTDTHPEKDDRPCHQ